MTVEVADLGAQTLAVPMGFGPPVLLEGQFPLTEEAWQYFIGVLVAMKPGLVRERAGVAESGREGGNRASTDARSPDGASGQQNRIDPTASHPGAHTD